MANESWLPSLFGERRGQPDPFRALQKDMDELFADWAGAFRRTGAAEGFTPRVDVSESDKEIKIVAELPGVEEKDVEVTLSGNQLTIKGQKRHESEEKKEEKGRTYHRIERSFGSFQRVMSVPYDIDPGKVTAEFKAGVLTVTLPKPAEVVAQTKKIAIKSQG